MGKSGRLMIGGDRPIVTLMICLGAHAVCVGVSSEASVLRTSDLACYKREAQEGVALTGGGSPSLCRFTIHQLFDFSSRETLTGI